MVPRDVIWVLSLLVKSPKSLIWISVVFCTWIRREFFSPFANWVVDTWAEQSEEAAKVFVREVFNFFSRNINGASIILGSLFLGEGWHRTGSAAWKDKDQPIENSAWAGLESTFNAVVARSASHTYQSALK
jgi:hypothetical protein